MNTFGQKEFLDISVKEFNFLIKYKRFFFTTNKHFFLKIQSLSLFPQSCTFEALQ